ncbi:hypothetical protein ALQ18_200012 [Pseudomonas marginalis pv. marginalis]|nr:hypothetical protein ALQ18_200012 [Pseudomonas marginalis pv. marginalis]
MRGPDNFAVRRGEFLRCAEVVELIVEGFGFTRTKAFQQRQRPKAVRLVDITAMTVGVMLGNQLVALPKKLCGLFVHGFADAPPKRVVAIASGLPVGLGNANQPVLAVVAVFGDELMAFTAPFADQVAEGVVVVMMVALDHQAVAGNDVGAGAVLHQQVAGRVVTETFFYVL